MEQSASLTRAFTDADLLEYSDLTGDTNPLTTDHGYAKKHGFMAPLIPGGLIGGLFSCLLGTTLPGRGAMWMKQKLFYPVPAYPGRPLTATVEVIRLRPEKDLVNLRTICRMNEIVVCEGEALVLAKAVGEK